MPFQNDRGQSLVQVLVSAAIAMIVMSAMTSMLMAQQRETRSLGEKVASLDLSRTMSGYLASASACSSIISTPGNVVNPSLLTFSPTTAYPFSIYLNSIPLGAGQSLISTASPISSLSNTLQIKKTNGLELQVISATNGNVILHFDQESLVRPVKDLSFPVSLATASAAPNVQIVGCSSGSGGAGASATAPVCNGDLTFHSTFGNGTISLQTSGSTLTGTVTTQAPIMSRPITGTCTSNANGTGQIAFTFDNAGGGCSNCGVLTFSYSGTWTTNANGSQATGNLQHGGLWMGSGIMSSGVGYQNATWDAE